MRFRKLVERVGARAAMLPLFFAAPTGGLQPGPGRAIGAESAGIGEADLLVRKCLAKNAKGDEQVRDFDSLVQLPEAAADVGLRKLVLSGHPSMAYQAAVYCAQNGRLAAIRDELPRVITAWEPNDQIGVLISILHKQDQLRGNTAAAAVARAVLGKKAAMKAGDLFGMPDPTGLAVRIIVATGAPDARQLAESAVDDHPMDWPLWISLVQLGGIDARRQQLARSVYTDKDAPTLSRVAAAIALEKDAPAASKYALGEIASFVDAHANIPDDKLAAQLLSDETGRRFQSFQRGLNLVLLLQFMKSVGIDDPLVAKLLKSRNEQCQTLGALVVAQRWPSLLLKPDSGVAKSNFYKPLLAFAASKHPELRDEIARAIGGTAVLDAELKKIHDLGAGAVVGFGGEVILWD